MGLALPKAERRHRRFLKLARPSDHRPEAHRMPLISAGDIGETERNLFPNNPADLAQINIAKS